MSIYWIIVIIVLGLGLLIPEKNERSRRLLVFLLFAVHLFVCGFKYQYLTGDLYVYSKDYESLLNCSLFSAESFGDGRNPLWFFFNKVVCDITNGNIIIFVFIHSLIIEFCMAHFVMKHSPKPWLSYLVWDCMSFYLYGFSAIKQALAMALLMIAAEGIFEKKKIKFLIFAILAGLVHFPAFIFLVSYWIAQRELTSGFLVGYIVVSLAVLVLRNPIAGLLSSNYYEEALITDANKLVGGRFFVIIIIVGLGFLLKGFREERFKSVFILVAIAAIPQLLSVFDNVFTRLADYYLQFTVLYFPLLLTTDAVDSAGYDAKRIGPVITLSDDRTRIFITLVITAGLLLWFYLAEMRFETPNVPMTYYCYSFFWEHSI